MDRPGLSPKRSPPSLPRAEFPVILWARETCSPLRTGWRLRCWLRLVLNGHGLALLPGDAEAPYLRALLRSSADLSADVLVLPHHGSAGSLVPALYDAVSPKLAIASAGAYNPYRLPSRKVRDALEWRDIPLHITGNEGEIAVHWDLKKNAGKKNILQEGFPPPRPHLSQYVQPMGRARESSPAGNTK